MSIPQDRVLDPRLELAANRLVDDVFDAFAAEIDIQEFIDRLSAAAGALNASVGGPLGDIDLLDDLDLLSVSVAVHLYDECDDRVVIEHIVVSFLQNALDLIDGLIQVRSPAST